MSPSWLPVILREIADSAGLEAALKLAEAKGGTRIYVPKTSGARHWLTELLGRPAADAVCLRAHTLPLALDLVAPLHERGQRRLELLHPLLHLLRRREGLPRRLLQRPRLLSRTQLGGGRALGRPLQRIDLRSQGSVRLLRIPARRL